MAPSATTGVATLGGGGWETPVTAEERGARRRVGAGSHLPAERIFKPSSAWTNGGSAVPNVVPERGRPPLLRSDFAGRCPTLRSHVEFVAH